MRRYFSAVVVKMSITSLTESVFKLSNGQTLEFQNFGIYTEN